MRGDEFFVKLAARPPFSRLHPGIAGVLKDYLAGEKAVPFGDRWVVNTHFPPFPSPAFDNLARQFGCAGPDTPGQLYSVTLAVTNRCPFRCWHCYNAGRREDDLPLDALGRVVGELQDLGATMVTLTGGEPLLRQDLEQIVARFDERSALVLGTTGEGLTALRAAALRSAGLFAVGISLDADRGEEHDRLRGRPGAFLEALRALAVTRDAGLYPYVVAVATRDLLAPDRFWPFVRFAADAGAREVHLLEPSATGRLAGRRDVLLSRRERGRLLALQAEAAADDTLPVVSTFAHIESPRAFGCGAGLTHIYIDGSGEVSPCNLVPLSFGNVRTASLASILPTMREHFARPRTACVGRMLAPVALSVVPAPPAESVRICRQHLREGHPVPRFFKLREQAGASVGAAEVQAAYDRIHGSYDACWLTQAAGPIRALLAAMRPLAGTRVFEAGCGTGYTTSCLARAGASVVAADLSEQMLAAARARLAGAGRTDVRLVAGDALDLLEREAHPEPFEAIVSTWVLGYIPLASFFTAAFSALAPGGELGFVVHRDNSPREVLAIFAELVARDPSVLQKRVAFDFPRDATHAASELRRAGFTPLRSSEGEIVFRFAQPEEVLDHLLGSGAGTAFYDAILPARRPALTQAFIELVRVRMASADGYAVRHEYVSCVARR